MPFITGDKVAQYSNITRKLHYGAPPTLNNMTRNYVSLNTFVRTNLFSQPGQQMYFMPKSISLR